MCDFGVAPSKADVFPAVARRKEKRRVSNARQVCRYREESRKLSKREAHPSAEARMELDRLVGLREVLWMWGSPEEQHGMALALEAEIAKAKEALR